MGKSTKAEINRRVNIVAKMLCDAQTNSVIIQFAADEWGTGERNTRNYIKQARDLIREDYSVDRQDFLTSRLALLDKITRQAISAGQYSNAVGSLML